MVKQLSILVDICDPYPEDPEATKSLLTDILASAFDKLGLAAIVVAVEDRKQLARIEHELRINELEMWGPAGFRKWLKPMVS